MIKILILFALIALTTSIGVFLSGNKKRRMAVYSELYEFNEQLLVNIKFSRRPLEKVAENFKFIPCILAGKEVLTGDDGKFIGDYMYNLGGSDAVSQVDYLNERKVQLKKFRDESAEDYKRYRELYIKIFFMLGILMAVLLA